ncbi:MAG: TetR/AcrR family transcriptional regulator [Paludibacter sp.]|nr:TetR/AcrR family transcriptional regulator [Paludibacter sp.]
MEIITENIIQVAARQFHQIGIRNVSIDNVCAELRMSKKTFYQYFVKKEDLIDAVIAYEQNQHIEKIQKCIKDKNAIEIFIFMIKEIKKNTECAPFLFWYDLKKYYPRLYQKYDQIKTERMKAAFEENIRKGIEEGYFRENLDVELLSLFHSVQINETLETMTRLQKKYTLKRLTDFFIDMIIHLIVNEKGLKYVQENLTEKK